MSIATPSINAQTLNIHKNRRHFRPPALAALLAACLCALPAHADLLPSIPKSFPLDLDNGKFSALRYTISGNTQAFNPLVAGDVDSDVYSTSDTLATNNFAATLQKLDGITSNAGTTSATAVSNAIAGFGKLRGSAVSHLTGGVSSAKATTEVEFFDLIQIKRTDQVTPNFNFNINWKVDGILDGLSPSVVADLWIIDVRDHAPRAFELITGPLFLHSAWGGNQAPSGVLGQFTNAQVGARYWVYGRMHLETFRAVNVFTGPETDIIEKADFTDTVQFFIDPAPDSPTGFIDAASGSDYTTPAPEPSTLLLALGTLLTTALAPRPRRRH